MSVLKDQVNQPAFLKKLPAIITLSLLVITLYTWNQAVNSSAYAYKEYFDFRVREAITSIQNRMATYQQVLHGTRGLYEAYMKPLKR